MNNQKKAFLEVIFVLFTLQGGKLLLEQLMTPHIPNTRFADKMLTMSVMLFLACGVWLYAKARKVKLSVFPKPFSKRYIIFTAFAAALYIATPSNYIVGFSAVMVLIYGSIVTPVYEELLFRGFVWNRIEPNVARTRTTYVLTSVLFGIWHVGYMIPQLLDGNLFAVVSKMAVGLGYGFILGFVRLKTGNCYATILTHGIMNLFAF